MRAFSPAPTSRHGFFTILRNEFYSQMRKRGREVQDSDGIMTARLAVHPAQHGQLDLKDFRGALEQLPEDQREAIILIGASGFSYEEAAEICRLCGRNNQEPRQQGAHAPPGNPEDLRRGRIRSRCDLGSGHGDGGALMCGPDAAIRTLLHQSHPGEPRP